MDIQTYLNLFPLTKVTDGSRVGIVTAWQRYAQRDENGLILHTKPLHVTVNVLWPDGDFTMVDYLRESDAKIIAGWQLVE